MRRFLTIAAFVTLALFMVAIFCLGWQLGHQVLRQDPGAEDDPLPEEPDQDRECV